MFPLLVATLLTQTPQVKPDIEYRKANDQSMKLDFYSPVTLSDKPAPLVVVIHGGSWMTGKRQDMAVFAQTLAKEGFAAATISYRLAPKDKWPSQIDDCQAAVRYLRANSGEYKIDPNRISSLGASAGGHLALLLGLTDTRDKTTKDYPLVSSRTQCVINVFGPTDMLNDYDPTLAGLLCMQVLGKSFDKSTEELRQFSPLTYVGKDAPPIFTLHGRADTLVPVKQAERLDEALKKFNITHETVLVDGMGHELPIEKPAVADAVKKAIAFLKARMMPTAE